MQEIAEIIKAPTEQSVLHVRRKLLLLTERSQRSLLFLLESLCLIFNDSVGSACRPRIKQQQVMLQLVESVLVNPQRIHNHTVPIKLNEIKAPEARCILILMAASYLQILPFD